VIIHSLIFPFSPAEGVDSRQCPLAEELVGIVTDWHQTLLTESPEEWRIIANRSTFNMSESELLL